MIPTNGFSKEVKIGTNLGKRFNRYITQYKMPLNLKFAWQELGLIKQRCMLELLSPISLRKIVHIFIECISYLWKRVIPRSSGIAKPTKVYHNSCKSDPTNILQDDQVEDTQGGKDLVEGDEWEGEVRMFVNRILCYFCAS